MTRPAAGSSVNGGTAPIRPTEGECSGRLTLLAAERVGQPKPYQASDVKRANGGIAEVGRSPQCERERSSVVDPGGHRAV
jgi:hypothetical protein